MSSMGTLHTMFEKLAREKGDRVQYIPNVMRGKHVDGDRHKAALRVVLEHYTAIIYADTFEDIATVAAAAKLSGARFTLYLRSEKGGSGWWIEKEYRGGFS